MNETKSYSVITSKTAKDHLGRARVLLTDTQNNILMQSQRVAQQKMQNENIVQEEQKQNAANMHERQMQHDKLLGVMSIT